MSGYLEDLGIGDLRIEVLRKGDLGVGDFVRPGAEKFIIRLEGGKYVFLRK